MKLETKSMSTINLSKIISKIRKLKEKNEMSYFMS